MKKISLIIIFFVIFLWVINLGSFISNNITTIILLCSILLYIFISWEYNKFKEIFNWAKLLYFYWKIYNYVMYILYCLFVNPAELYNLITSLIDNVGKEAKDLDTEDTDVDIEKKEVNGNAVLFWNVVKGAIVVVGGIIFIAAGYEVACELYKLWLSSNNGGDGAPAPAAPANVYHALGVPIPPVPMQAVPADVYNALNLPVPVPPPPPLPVVPAPPVLPAAVVPLDVVEIPVINDVIAIIEDVPCNANTNIVDTSLLGQEPALHLPPLVETVQQTAQTTKSLLGLSDTADSVNVVPVIQQQQIPVDIRMEIQIPVDPVSTSTIQIPYGPHLEQVLQPKEMQCMVNEPHFHTQSQREAFWSRYNQSSERDKISMQVDLKNKFMEQLPYVYNLIHKTHGKN